MKQKRMRSVLALGVAAVLFTGCGTHNPTTDVNLRKERSASFQDLMVKDAAIEPVQTSMTLSMAIARAVKYNLDHRVKMMETAVAQEQLSLARMSYLPEVTAMAGYSSRNNEPGAISRSLATGDVSLEYSTSQEKDHTITSLRGAWDVIDFGLTYYSVSQKTDEILIAQEQRRKVVQNIIQDVQEAYWRAYIAQELLGQVNAIATESDQALVRFKSLANTGKVDPKEGLGEQRELLQIRYNMRNLQEQLSQGRIHLNALLNLPPGTEYHLEAVSRESLPTITPNVSKLETMALMNRPELRIEDSKLKISQADVKKSVLEMLPHVEFWGELTDDTNEYLYNESWNEVGVQVSWNLLGAAQGLGKHGVYEAEEDLAEARHRALSMAVLAQVHLAVNRYGIALAKYEDASQLEDVSGKLSKMLQKDSQRVGKMGFDRIRANLQATSSKMEGMLAYAEVQNALMRVYHSLGVDPIEDIGDGTASVPELAKKIDGHLQKMNDAMQQ